MTTLRTTVIQDEEGTFIKAVKIKHLSVETGLGDNVDVELYRLMGGTLVVCKSPANDCRVRPQIDPTSTPAQYGYYAS